MNRLILHKYKQIARPLIVRAAAASSSSSSSSSSSFASYTPLLYLKHDEIKCTIQKRRFFTTNTNNENDDKIITEKTKKRRQLLEEIQKQHLQQIETFDKKKVKKMTEKEHKMKHEIKAMRGSDGFLEFEEIDPPWKDREGTYKPVYILDDLNWLFRKSKKADLIIGGGSIFICCAMGFSVYFSDLPPI